MSEAAPAIQVLTLGLNTDHEKGFLVDRTDGSGAWLFMQFLTPFRIVTRDGLVTGQPGDCVLHDPAFPQFHTDDPADAYGFRNNWFHFCGSGLDELVSAYAVPCNTLINVPDINRLDSLMTQIMHEFVQQPLYHGRGCRLLFEQILLQLARSQAGRHERSLTLAEQGYYHQFSAIRSQLFSQPGRINQVAQLARQAGLSASRFSCLYQTFFGVSPKTDLLRARMEAASSLLVSTKMTVDQIAAHCGFASPFYFSRIFKKYIGQTPSQYRSYGIWHSQGKARPSSSLPQV